MDLFMSLLLLSSCACAFSEPLSAAIKRRSDLGGVYASDYNQDYEPVTFVAIPLHKPMPVLQILSRSPLLEGKYNKQSKQRSYGQRIKPHKTYSHAVTSQETYEPQVYASSSPSYAVSTQQVHRPHAYATSTSHTWYDWSDIDESESKYPRPISKYPRPTSEYPRPHSEEDHVVYFPSPSNEAIANKYPRQISKYPRPTSEYPRPTSDYSRPVNEYQRPLSEEDQVVLVPTPGYEESVNKYPRPITKYSRPIRKYPKPAGKYRRPVAKYQKPVNEEGEPVLLVPTPSNEEPLILFAKPNKYGGYTYSKPQTKKRSPPKKKEPIIIRVHKYRIIRER